MQTLKLNKEDLPHGFWQRTCPINQDISGLSKVWMIAWFSQTRDTEHMVMSNLELEVIEGYLGSVTHVGQMLVDNFPAEARLLPIMVNSQDTIDLFTKNTASDSLRKICNARIVHAYSFETGAEDEKCTKLAKLDANAMDFPTMVTVDPDLKSIVYPDFIGKDDFMSYKSDKILVRLYRLVKNISQELKSEIEEIYLRKNPIWRSRVSKAYIVDADRHVQAN